ncbi:response regulator [Myxococcus dinghuensis]|uniref:hypothetical protein n=1 Tax=Myxococcus dinghuensis TaxID=2906761 RepID=UPI0021140FA6|nr:hypothetical protein [Myxococcus dinghuensis]
MPLLAGARRTASASRGPRVMVVSESPMLRLAMGRELSPSFEVVTALGAASADRRLDVGVALDAMVVDLDAPEQSGVPEFLARLVAERDFGGPRILVSSRFRPEMAAAFSGSCLTHFALARPWRPGSLRALMSSVLGTTTPLRAAGAR